MNDWLRFELPKHSLSESGLDERTVRAVARQCEIAGRVEAAQAQRRVLIAIGHRQRAAREGHRCVGAKGKFPRSCQLLIVPFNPEGVASSNVE